MEADISIWQKPGHFYFALTRQRGSIWQKPGHFYFALTRQRGSRAVPGSGPPALKSGPRDNWATRA